MFLPGESKGRWGGAWWAAVYGVAQSWTRLKRLSSSSHPNGFKVVPHCGFHLHSLMINDTEHLMCLLAICISSLQKLIEMFCSFLNHLIFLSFSYRKSYKCMLSNGILNFPKENSKWSMRENSKNIFLSHQFN